MADEVQEEVLDPRAQQPLPEGQVPRYKTLQATFLAPNLIPEGKIIEFDGEPGPHLEPLNEAAQVMMDNYYKAKPEARVTAVEQLPMTMGASGTPTARVVGDAPPDEIISFVDMANRAGYTQEKAKVTSLGEARNRVG